METHDDCLATVSWREILTWLLIWFERGNDCELIVDREILNEVQKHTRMSLGNYGLPRPNIAKIAGVFSFWFRKLKPLHYSLDSNTRYTAVNEYLGLMVGLALCEKYKADLGNSEFKIAAIPKRLVLDWVNSLRVHSHSPNSTTMSFELITTGQTNGPG